MLLLFILNLFASHYRQLQKCHLDVESFSNRSESESGCNSAALDVRWFNLRGSVATKSVVDVQTVVVAGGTAQVANLGNSRYGVMVSWWPQSSHSPCPLCTLLAQFVDFWYLVKNRFNHVTWLKGGDKKLSSNTAIYHNNDKPNKNEGATFQFFRICDSGSILWNWRWPMSPCDPGEMSEMLPNSLSPHVER